MRQYDLLTVEQKAELRGKSEAEREKIFAKYAKTWISQFPGQYAQLCGLRLVKTLWIEWDNPKSWDRLYVYFTTRTLLLLATPIGLYMAWRRGWRVGYPLLLSLTCLLTYTLTIAAARFALPFEPLQLVLLALIPTALFRRAKAAAPGFEVVRPDLQAA